MEQLLVGLLSAAIGRQLAIGRWAGPRLTLKWHWKPTVACPYVPRPLPLQLLSLWLLIFVHFIDDLWRFLRKFQDFQPFLKRFFIKLIQLNYYLLFISNRIFRIFMLRDFFDKIQDFSGFFKRFLVKISGFLRDFLFKFQDFMSFRAKWGFFRIFRSWKLIFCPNFRIFWIKFQDFAGFFRYFRPEDFSGFFKRFFVNISGFLFKFQDFLFKFQDFYVISR